MKSFFVRAKKVLTWRVAASILFLVSCDGHAAKDENADLAQLVERLIRNEQVVGSSPIISSISC